MGDASEPVDAEVDADAISPPADAGPGCNGAVACERVVFVTHDTFNGHDLDSLANADDLCTTRGKFFTPVSRVKDRVFRAWLSTAGSTAAARHVHGTAPYIRPDGTLIANNWADLTNGDLAAPISIDSSGAAANGTAWTGTTATGTAVAGGNCNVWNSPAEVGTVGSVAATDGKWTQSASVACNTMRRLYCVEY